MSEPSFKLSLLRAAILVVTLELFRLSWIAGEVVLTTFIVGEGDPDVVASTFSESLIDLVLAIPSIFVFGLILWWADRFVLLRRQQKKAD